METGNKTAVILILLVFAILVVAAAPFVGMKLTPLNAVLHPSTAGREGEIFWKLRVPRVSVAFLAGSALAVAGMVFQAVFRNALATPFTLGVSSGAALGASLYIRFGLPLAVLGISGTSISAFAGAMLSILLVYGLTRARRGFSTATMLLAGVAVSFFFSSVNLFTQYVSDFTQTFRIIRWLMGGVQVVGFLSLWRMIPFVVVGLISVFYMTNELNLFMMGEEIAAARGVDVVKARRILFFASSFMVGGVVAVCGPIGFVGMMVPHICRILVGPNHRNLIPATILFGGAFLTLCDTLARTVIAPAEIPVGIITALLGGPFFVWLLLRGSADESMI